MISNIDVKNRYIELYKQIRRYFWDYEFVKNLVDLEDEVLVRFPDMKKVRNLLNTLYMKCKDTANSDECLGRAFSSMRDVVENNECDFSYVVVNIKE